VTRESAARFRKSGEGEPANARGSGRSQWEGEVLQWLPRAARYMTAAFAAASIAVPALAAADAVGQVFTLVNQQRAAHGLPPLVRNSALDQSAADYAAQMASHSFFSHTGLDGSTPLTRMQAAGYTNVQVWGENIAAGQLDAASVMTAWMNGQGGSPAIAGSTTLKLTRAVQPPLSLPSFGSHGSLPSGSSSTLSQGRS
jgi:hypothetical protein